MQFAKSCCWRSPVILPWTGSPHVEQREPQALRERPPLSVAPAFTALSSLGRNRRALIASPLRPDAIS
jgi:hypothetical protein